VRTAAVRPLGHRSRWPPSCPPALGGVSGLIAPLSDRARPSRDLVRRAGWPSIARQGSGRNYGPATDHGGRPCCTDPARGRCHHQHHEYQSGIRVLEVVSKRRHHRSRHQRYYHRGPEYQSTVTRSHVHFSHDSMERRNTKSIQRSRLFLTPSSHDLEDLILKRAAQLHLPNGCTYGWGQGWAQAPGELGLRPPRCELPERAVARASRGA
jgi:hypothetical protein